MCLLRGPIDACQQHAAWQNGEPAETVVRGRARVAAGPGDGRPGVPRPYEKPRLSCRRSGPRRTPCRGADHAVRLDAHSPPQGATPSGPNVSYGCQLLPRHWREPCRHRRGWSRSRYLAACRPGRSRCSSRTGDEAPDPWSQSYRRRTTKRKSKVAVLARTIRGRAPVRVRPCCRSAHQKDPASTGLDR